MHNLMLFNLVSCIGLHWIGFGKFNGNGIGLEWTEIDWIEFETNTDPNKIKSHTKSLRIQSNTIQQSHTESEERKKRKGNRRRQRNGEGKEKEHTIFIPISLISNSTDRGSSLNASTSVNAGNTPLLADNALVSRAHSTGIEQVTRSKLFSVVVAVDC